MQMQKPYSDQNSPTTSMLPYKQHTDTIKSNKYANH